MSLSAVYFVILFREPTMRPILLFRWLLLFSLFGVSCLATEKFQLILRTGDRLQGNCLRVENGLVFWQTAYGDTIRAPLIDVTELTSESMWDLEFSNGQNLRGTWNISSGVIVVSTTLFGTLRCPASELRAAIPAVSARGLPVPPTSAAESPQPSLESSDPSRSTDEAPPSSLQTLLRQSSVLLRPGQWSVTVGINYLHDRTLYSPTDTRQLIALGYAQRGITPRMEAALSWPLLATSTTLRLPTPNGGYSTQQIEKLRAGDPELSATFLLFGEGRIRPECVAVTGITIPINPADEGGLFRTRLGLEFLKTSDPGALFAGFGWSHAGDGWEAAPYRPLDRFNYHLGLAIGLNDELAIGMQVQGEYLEDTFARNGTLLATSTEAVFGKFWFNFRLNNRSFVEASVAAPMNDDAHATSFGVSYIRRY